MKFNKIKFSGVFSLLFIVTLVLLGNKFLVRAQTPTTITVCATGTAGQNGCNFIGGEGIQAAINSAPYTPTISPIQKTTILIKSGNYTRASAEIIYTGGVSYRCFITNKSRNLIIEGVGNVRLDGANSGEMNGICLNGRSEPNLNYGYVDIKNLIVSGFKNVNNNGIIVTEGVHTSILRNNISSNAGNGIKIIHGSIALMISNRISDNNIGITNDNETTVYIKNNQIFKNRQDGVRFDNGNYQYNSEVINNVLFANNTSNTGNQLSFYNKANVKIINNLITNGTQTAIYKNNQSASLHTGTLIIKYNDVYGNSVGRYSGGLSDQTGLNGNISVDPLYKNSSIYDFQLKAGSPALDTGDPSILDTDGTRSDMGAYGGSSGNPPAATATPVPTNTPVPPTNTPPLATNTLPPPTNTPSPSCPSANKGNLNCDPQGCVNNEDFNLFRNNYFGKVIPTSIPQNQSTPNLYPDNNTIIDTADYEILRQNYNKCAL